MGMLVGVNEGEKAFCLYNGLVYRVYRMVKEGSGRVRGVVFRGEEEEHPMGFLREGWEWLEEQIREVRKVVKRGERDMLGVMIETLGRRLVFGNIFRKVGLTGEELKECREVVEEVVKGSRGGGVAISGIKAIKVEEEGFWASRDKEERFEYGEPEREAGLADVQKNDDGFMKEIPLVAVGMDSFVWNVRKFLRTGL